MPLFGKRLLFTKSRCEVTTVVSIKTLEEVITPTGSRASKKKYKGEIQGCGQIFHRVSLG